LAKESGIGAGDKRLGRHATGIDAGSAELLPLDEGDFHARLGESGRERWSGLAAADDDCVEALRVHPFHDSLLAGLTTALPARA
jgi:hypothetical protein